MKRSTSRALLGLLLALSVSIGCKPRPTGISGVVRSTEQERVQVRIVELLEQQDASVPLFVERDTAYEQPLSVGDPFTAQLRPGHYVIKILSLQGDVLLQRKVSVKRNKMSHLELKLP